MCPHSVSSDKTARLTSALLSTYEFKKVTFIKAGLLTKLQRYIRVWLSKGPPKPQLSVQPHSSHNHSHSRLAFISQCVGGRLRILSRFHYLSFYSGKVELKRSSVDTHLHVLIHLHSSTVQPTIFDTLAFFPPPPLSQKHFV